MDGSRTPKRRGVRSAPLEVAHATWPRRCGLTLTEVLTTISIIGMLLSILLPGVQAGREAGRQTVCKSNLRQVADTFYPGWRCTVDGKEAPIESVYGVFRGVRLPAGRHRVEMWYAPTSFWAGLVGAICGVTAVTALVVRRRK